jgi:hypothetical protein
LHRKSKDEWKQLFRAQWNNMYVIVHHHFLQMPSQKFVLWTYYVLMYLHTNICIYSGSSMGTMHFDDYVHMYIHMYVPKYKCVYSGSSIRMTCPIERTITTVQKRSDLGM